MGDSSLEYWGVLYLSAYTHRIFLKFNKYLKIQLLLEASVIIFSGILSYLDCESVINVLHTIKKKYSHISSSWLVS